MSQERLWITEPRRATCLAEVTAVRGDTFQVDRALFAPRSPACRHPQEPDRGRIWWDGDKRPLHSTRERMGAVWYRLPGAVPPVGTTLRCELDQETRQQTSRAHTAMHLFLGALPREVPPLAAPPEVKGGGHARVVFTYPLAAETLAAALQAVHGAVDANTPVEREHLERSEALRKSAHPAYADGTRFPEGDVLPVVRTGEATMPCDGTHVDRTGQVGRVVVPHARRGRGGFVVNVKVQ